MNINLVQTSESETYVEADVHDIVSIISIKIGGKRILVNVFVAPIDNVSFHYEISVHNYKYVFKEGLQL